MKETWRVRTVVVFVSHNNRQFFLSKHKRQMYMSARYVPDTFDHATVQLSYKVGTKLNLVGEVKKLYPGFEAVRNPDMNFKVEE